jgi:serine phosphatase RsbU (regulator of sigma subunit)
MKVAQLVREQQAEAKERERIQQELEVAALIQQTLLPKELPSIPGWHLDAFYRPAQAVGGDFYDFIALEDGRLGVVDGAGAGSRWLGRGGRVDNAT